MDYDITIDQHVHECYNIHLNNNYAKGRFS